VKEVKEVEEVEEVEEVNKYKLTLEIKDCIPAHQSFLSVKLRDQKFVQVPSDL